MASSRVPIFAVIGHSTINIPEILQVFTVFLVTLQKKSSYCHLPVGLQWWEPNHLLVSIVQNLYSLEDSTMKWLTNNSPATIHSNPFTPRPSYGKIICHSNFRSVDEILWCNYSNKISLTQLLHKVLLYKEKFDFFLRTFFSGTIWVKGLSL